MDINKQKLIYILILIITILLAYIFLQEPAVQTVTETEYKTIVKEKVVYRDNECPGATLNSLEKSPAISSQEEQNVFTQNEYTLASVDDSQRRYSISLLSSIKPLKSTTYERVILNGKLIDNDHQSIFILEFDRGQLDDSGDLLFKVTKRDNTGTSYLQYNPCLYNLMGSQIYKVELDISSGEIACLVEEDRVLTADENKPLIKDKVKSISPDRAFSIKESFEKTVRE